MKVLRTLASTLLLSTILGTPWANAETDAEMIVALKTELESLRLRLERLEGDRKVPEVAYQIPATAAPATAPGWEDKVRWKGDFRYRHETIDAESSSKRNRQRIRARPALVADLSDSLEVGFGLSTGGDDPVSSNQTLGGGFSSKEIALDLAYFSWETPIDGLSWTAGKFKNPLLRAGDNGLIWDSDLRPEGSNVTFKRGAFAATALGLWATESSGDDSFILGAQAGWNMQFGENTNLIFGAGYFDLSDAKGKEVFFDGNPRGNTINANGEYVYGYEELEVFAELSFNVADIPTLLFADYVQNLDADEFNTGYAIGGSVEFGRDKRPWSLTYVYQDLEADAVLGMFTDSDFIGGGTDGTGHIFRGSYALTKNVSLAGSLFVNERGGNQGVEEDYNRLQLDVEFKY